eukprot:1448512-Rhodomonas_salina.2
MPSVSTRYRIAVQQETLGQYRTAQSGCVAEKGVAREGRKRGSPPAKGDPDSSLLSLEARYARSVPDIA